MRSSFGMSLYVIFASFLVSLPISVFADCLYAGQIVPHLGMVDIDCVMLHNTNLEYIEKCGKLVCKGTELYFANERTLLGTGLNRVFTCDSEAPYGRYHPWHFQTAVADAVYSNTETCRGSEIEVTLPKQFSIVCIDGSVRTGYPTFFVGTRENNNKVNVFGHNCKGGFSSKQCNTLFEFGANAKVIIPFVPLEQKTLDVFAAMQTKYDYHITEAHLPFGIIQGGWQTIKLLDPDFSFSIDKVEYCGSESIAISGKSTCCGEPGTNVEIEIKNATGNVVKSVSTKIDANGVYNATVSLSGLPFGNYSVEAKAPLNSRFDICKKSLSFRIRNFSLMFGTSSATIPTGGSFKVSGYSICCTQPGQKVRIELKQGSTTIFGPTDADVLTNGYFEKNITLPSGVLGEIELIVSTPSTQSECRKQTKIVAYYPEKITNLQAENLKTGDKTKALVECTADMPMKLKVYSQNNELLAEQSYTCNSGVIEFGPELEEGVYKVEAIGEIDFCLECRAEKYFSVLRPSGEIYADESHILLIICCAFAALFIVSRKKVRK
ncbi:MAG: carboxypeptidase-like regulatory domain-containing protein [Candidatus Diapherotrites archaeon]|nr:carboxypeptidase-like regulatory domain-containing protein [Candidatus Diapherotrites archaeon]